MGEDGFSFAKLPPPQPLAPTNPLLRNATVVDRSGANGAAEPSGAASTTTAAMPPPPAPPTQPAPVPPATKPRRKVPFEKGYSQMDWIRLTQSGTDLTGLGVGTRPGARRSIPMSEVKLHSTPEDGWTVLRGKVYNLTPYLRFHPGGEAILKGVLGRDGTLLFNKYHAWVNAEFMLAKCCIGTVEVEEKKA